MSGFGRGHMQDFGPIVLVIARNFDLGRMLPSSSFLSVGVIQ
jgi:hypothetical protein